MTRPVLPAMRLERENRGKSVSLVRVEFMRNLRAD